MGLKLQSAVRLGHMADLRDARQLRIALAAVIEDENGRLFVLGAAARRSANPIFITRTDSR